MRNSRCVLIKVYETMPRVVVDQKSKFETDELFKKLSQETDVRYRYHVTPGNLVRLRHLFQVKYTGCRDKPHEERKTKFREDLSNGIAVVVSVATYHVNLIKL